MTPKPANQQPSSPNKPSQGKEPLDWRQRALLGAGVLAVVVASGLWVYKALNAPADEDDTEQTSFLIEKPPRTIEPKKGPAHPQVIHPHGGLPEHGKAKNNLSDSFLESFAGKELELDDGDKGPVLANENLEKLLMTLEKKQQQMLEPVNNEVAVLEEELRRARRARPKDPVPQWLTAELLIMIRAEPQLVLPFLERARAWGLKNPRLWASLARVHFEANHWEQAYQFARKALDQGDRNRYVWNAFKLTAFERERFSEVADRLDRAFSERLPDWAAAIRRESVDLQARWQAEQKLRRAETKADDLPRVRLVIEHRRFVVVDGRSTAKIDSTGTEEVIVELFENEAPGTVANFLSLVSQRFYDGTKFYLAEPASLVAGGCPLTKNADPTDDGSGGPGYFIPDEFHSAKARNHFRGSVSMVNSGQPNTAGCQFLITLVAQPKMDRRFTVFGTVIQGQDAVERITPGRTHPDVGSFGRIIPGDVIVRAEVIRKRPHEYRVKKVPAP